MKARGYGASPSGSGAEPPKLTLFALTYSKNYTVPRRTKIVPRLYCLNMLGMSGLEC